MRQDSRATRRLLPSFIPLLALLLISACVKLPRRYASSTIQHDGQSGLLLTRGEAFDAPLIDINTASRAELERLPGIGAGLAARIIEHREHFGRFRRAEHLIMVRGIGERRFRKMRAFVRV